MSHRVGQWGEPRSSQKVLRLRSQVFSAQITITSLLLRLYHKMIVTRLKAAAPLPMELRGFAPEGVAAYILLLQLINDHVEQDQNCVAFVDFKKAFDSVSHPSLVAARKRWGFST